MKRLASLLFSALGALALVAPAAAIAQQYPTKPVVWIVPFPAGGLADQMARKIVPRFSKELGQPVIIENIGGAGGAVAAARILSAASDGYTLMQASPSEVILTPLVNTAVKYKPQDFTLISPFGNHPLSLIVKKDFPASTTEEFVAFVRSQPPGTVTYGSMGVGSLYHLAMEDLSGRLGLKMLHVPYKGGAPLLQDMAGGNLDAALLPFTTTYVDFAAQGRLKLVSLAAASRLEIIKTTPTMNESGVVKDFNVGLWSGLFVKAGTAPEITAKLHAALQTTMKDPSIRGAIDAIGTEVTKTMPLAETAAFINGETTRYRNLVNSLDIKDK